MRGLSALLVLDYRAPTKASMRGRAAILTPTLFLCMCVNDENVRHGSCSGSLMLVS